MTSVERYRPPRIDFPSDAPSNARPSHSTFSTITNIPPAVPSPPQLSRNSPPREPHPRAESTPTVKMASEDSSQWIFTEAEISSSPSIAHGIPPKDERCLRAKGANFILQAGILLKLPQLTIATASIFFQRFYMRASMDQSKVGGIHHYVRSSQTQTPSTSACPPSKLPRSKSHATLMAKDHQANYESMEQTIAGTALFLATKTEENCRKTKEVVIACAKVAQKNSNLVIDEQSKEYWRWRDNILLFEEQMLEFLTFDVVLKSPHNILYEILNKLHIEEIRKLRNAAWAFLNDGCLTTLYLQVPSRDCAIAAVYFAAGFTGETIPDDENGNPWWERVGGRPDKITTATGIMFEFWTENPLQRSENPYEQSPFPFASEEDLHRSRRRASLRADAGSNEDTPSPGQSQPMQNGHSQQSQASTAPAVNGNGVVAHNDKLLSPRLNAETSVNGSSDTALKEAANDPATHLSTGGSAISAAGPLGEAPKPSPKRKSPEDGDREEPPSKRSKKISDSSEESAKTLRSQNTSDNSEESAKTLVASETNEAADLEASGPIVEADAPKEPVATAEESEEGELEE
ncbi:Cyclin [Lachnellula subtilissima]|uniref:Cyclin n=1 Tax=Lachnellula subtilissima TaxID=602034 RepID=A0A8H8RPD8_9HELO|nr:Cyclin [Lachnellula subtilissima]